MLLMTVLLLNVSDVIILSSDMLTKAIIYLSRLAFERLPEQILREHCQKEKRVMPRYYNARGSKPDSHHYCVHLPDQKNSKDDLYFTPAAPTDGFESDRVGKDYAALLALFHFQVCSVSAMV